MFLRLSSALVLNLSFRTNKKRIFFCFDRLISIAICKLYAH